MSEIPLAPRPDALSFRRQSTHHQAVRADWQVIVHALNTNLGNGLLALIAGVRPETVSRWASGQNKDPRPAMERRVREAYTIYTDLVRVDSAHTVRAWFMGSNPLLGDDSPAEALAADRFKAVLAAARAFRDE